MATSIIISWTRIESWLMTHAPHTYGTLNPPAEIGGTESAEEFMGCEFPHDFKESLTRHDGSGNGWTTKGQFTFPGGYGPLPLTGMTEEWSRWCHMEKQRNERDDSQVWSWNRKWIPIADCSAADCLFIDQRPGPGQGAVGELLPYDQAYLKVWNSFADLLEATADALEQGREVDECRATVNEGILVWE